MIASRRAAAGRSSRCIMAALRTLDCDDASSRRISDSPNATALSLAPASGDDPITRAMRWAMPTTRPSRSLASRSMIGIASMPRAARARTRSVSSPPIAVGSPRANSMNRASPASPRASRIWAMPARTSKRFVDLQVSTKADSHALVAERSLTAAAWACMSRLVRRAMASSHGGSPCNPKARRNAATAFTGRPFPTLREWPWSP